MTLKTTLIITSFLFAAGTSFAIDNHHNAQVQITSKTYTVKVKGSKKDSQNDVLEEALYKAAKKTLKADYDWFKVVGRDTDSSKTTGNSGSSFRSGFETRPVRRCGLLSCTTDFRTQHSGSYFDYSSRSDVTRHNVTLEYKMGRGAMESNGNYYDAKALKSAK